MSHTNSTTNYNLPQFVGTDKPAWLTDINGAFSSIDTAIKSAKDTADTGSANATSALNKIGDLTTLTTTAKTDVVAAVNEIKTDAGTAQSTANAAGTAANQANLDIAALIAKFNINASSTQATVTATRGSVSQQPTLSQNSDGSMFKFYGTLQVNAFTSTNGASVPLTSIPGMSGFKGIATGCTLATAPDTAYTVNGSVYLSVHLQDDTRVKTTGGVSFAVGTDGQIYIRPRETTATTEDYASGEFHRYWMPACLYFNSNFGDTPEDN